MISQSENVDRVQVASWQGRGSRGRIDEKFGAVVEGVSLEGREGCGDGVER